MTAQLAPFAGQQFVLTVETLCKQVNWKISEIDDRHAILRFQMESGRSQPLFILRYDYLLEFSVPSMLAFDDVNEIPSAFSALMLQRNAQSKLGFWCIEKIASKFVFSIMYNIEMELLTPEYFQRVVQHLIRECDSLDGIMTNPKKN
jgi:hypothetical protein